MYKREEQERGAREMRGSASRTAKTPFEKGVLELPKLYYVCYPKRRAFMYEVEVLPRSPTVINAKSTGGIISKR